MLGKIGKLITHLLKSDDKLKNEVFLFIAYEIEGKDYDKHDLAGQTLYGITLQWEPALYHKIKQAIESGEKPKIESAILDAYNILYSDYQCGIFDSPLDLYYFDFKLNAGKHAVEGIQAGVNNIIDLYNLKIPKLHVDGVLGNHTRKCVKQLSRYHKQLYFELQHQRHQFYLNNKQHRYIRGWCNRCDQVEYILNRLI